MSAAGPIFLFLFFPFQFVIVFLFQVFLFLFFLFLIVVVFPFLVFLFLFFPFQFVVAFLFRVFLFLFSLFLFVVVFLFLYFLFQFVVVFLFQVFLFLFFLFLFVVYTDGVPEANNSAQELFGNERMLNALERSMETVRSEASSEKTDLRRFLSVFRAHVDDFVGETPQFDDLTMLCMEYEGSGSDSAPLTEGAETAVS